MQMLGVTGSQVYTQTGSSPQHFTNDMIPVYWSSIQIKDTGKYNIIMIITIYDK